MSVLIWIIVTLAIVLGVLCAAAIIWWACRERKPVLGDKGLERARHLFHLRREWLEANFLTLASQSGKPRGLAWLDCDFEDGVSFARDRNSGDLRAFVGVTISFEAVEGGGMEDNPNVGNLRAATAVFHFNGKDWATDGRAYFNLNPAEMIQRYKHELEAVE